MINQGDILKLSLDPTKGHEQKGYRPVVVISNEPYNTKTGFCVVYPISTTTRNYSMYVDLDSRTKTQGKILGDQMKSVDIKARPYKYIESISNDILDDILELASATLEKR